MLKQLKIKNFALIDDLDITFFAGLNVLTGETGAGKSIILESLSLLFGKRSDQEMIRHGFTKATVWGLFELKDKQEITILREIDLSGRHTIKINEEPTTLSKLKEVTKEIGSIHSQNETLALLDKELYLTFIDNIEEKQIEKAFNEYQIKRSKYLSSEAKLKEIQEKKKNSLDKKDYLEYQVKELCSLNLTFGELEDLKEKVKKLSNFDKIKATLINSYNFIENENFSISTIFEAKKTIERIKEYGEKYSDLSNRLDSLYYELDDIKSLIYDEIENFDFDEETFNNYQERIHQLENIESKYKMNIDKLINYYETIKEDLALITNYDGYLEEVRKEVIKDKELAISFADKLSVIRKKNAKKLEADIIEELKNLDLIKTKFHIEFCKTDSLLETGMDEVEFMISLNEGEIERPMHKVASGGERSRFLFALKSLFAIYNNLSVLVLDEIDVGVSGKTASLMAKKMASLSEKMQIIDITHLPQVAAFADHHFGITKTNLNGRMTTLINELNYDERILALALMLSDERVSNYAIEQAKMMIKK